MESRNFHTVHERPSLALALEELGPEKKKTIIKYKECLKNHAAAIGGNATDGCGEFMAAGDKGTPASLKCSACNCHRNFHKKHIESEDSDCPASPYYDHHLPPQLLPNNDSADQVIKPILTHNMCPRNYNKSGLNASDHESDEKTGDHRVMKKRFRTKFSEEQKEKMLRFADKVGWRMQKVEESVVQQFCQEVGIKRRVLKVWMHNNKNTFAKRNVISTS